MRSRARTGRRGGRVAGLAVGALAALAIGASGARADTTLTLDHGFMDLGGLTGQEVVKPADPVTMVMVPDGGTAFHATPAGVHFPHYQQSSSGVTIDFDIALDPGNNITGTYDPSTGILSTNPANFDVTVGVTGTLSGTCVLDVSHGNPLQLAFSTEATAPYLGDRFDAGSSPPVNGAIEATWSSLPPSATVSGVVCGTVDQTAAGPGGMWLSNGIATPSKASPPAAPAAPHKKKCKKKKHRSAAAAKKKCKKKKRK